MGKENLIEVLTCGTWDLEECDDRKWGGGTCDGCPYQKWVTPEELKRRTIIVSRHKGLVDWLERQGIVGDVISHATANDIRNNDIYGNLPLHLAALANSITTIDLPNLPPDMRGKELTPAQMDAAGAKLTKYKVTTICC